MSLETWCYDVWAFLTLVFPFPTATFSAEYSRPFANTAVNLTRQYLDSSHIPTSDKERFGKAIAPLVLWCDARSAAETGDRLLYTQDDLGDTPCIRDWLFQPFTGESTVSDQKLEEQIYDYSDRLPSSIAVRFMLPSIDEPRFADLLAQAHVATLPQHSTAFSHYGRRRRSSGPR